MTTPLNESATVQDLLFDDVPGEPVTALAQMMRERGTIAGCFPPALIGAARHELADATTRLMSANLADIAATGWKKYDALKKAALRTRDDPTAKELVSLVTHRIVSSHRPSVDVYLDGRTIATVEIELDVALTISGVLAVVTQGRLAEIKSGNCTARGAVTVQGIEMITKQAKFDLYGAFHLGNHGVPLLTRPASNDPVEPVVVGKADAPQTPGAWYPDPTRRYQSRWWDGSRWTQHVATDGRTTSDPLLRETDSDRVTRPIPLRH